MLPDNEQVNELIASLCDYAEERGLITRDDRVWAANAICEDMRMSSFADRAPAARSAEAPELRLEKILNALCDAAAAAGIIPDTASSRDNFDTRLMGHLTPRPSSVSARFAADAAVSPRLATDNFYRMCRDCNYIRASRVARDLRWSVPSVYGDIDISINMSKPEKDPRDIAAALNAPKSGYPACLLCHENVGYPGSVTAPARQNLRQIALPLGGENWYMQYSPYVYYNEHCIVLSPRHEPMRISHDTFVRLLDFVAALPHYFIGSNADLPVVGGSILTHDHMQGGCYEFPMARAPIAVKLDFADFPGVSAGIVRWPMSVIRLRAADRAPLVALADRILDAWRAYPLGVFHPHPDKHNIKKENIGLIEVMGLAVLPSRLKAETERLASLIVSGADIAADPVCGKHAAWVGRFIGNYKAPATEYEAMTMLRSEIGATFVDVLRDAGVYKDDAAGRTAFLRFAAAVGGR